MKKIAVLLAGALLFASAACAPASHIPDDPAGKTTEISLWTFPVGGWGMANSVAALLSSFHSEHPEIRVTLTCIDYVTGDQKIEEAIEQHATPDLILEGPERLVANWGVRGLMTDLNDLWEEEGDVFENVAGACHDREGNYYISPICMTTHCMAINRDLFEAAGALDCIDEETHTWSREQFVEAVGKIEAYYAANGIEKDVAVLYCNGQGGDQGTRALVTNLGGGTFTNKDHTEYTVNSPQNADALTLLKNLKGIRIDKTMTGSDEQVAFCEGELAMSFCWNVAGEINRTVNDPEREFDIFPMAFPTAEGDPSLQGGIWGFGIFDNHNEARIAAAKEFIRYFTKTQYSNAVTLSSYLPVRNMARDPYENDQLMREYSMFSRYLGDYYQITPDWAKARKAWWNLLQHIGDGSDIATELAAFPATFPAETAPVS